MAPGTIALAVLAVLGLAVVALYNRFVRSRNRVEAAWSDLDVQLERRHDLIPSLVEVVRGYAGHERATFDAVLTARSTGMAARDPEALTGAEEQVAATMTRLMYVAEAYPELKADARFRDLQIELGATENKIAFSRQLYNDVVTSYATATQSFPGLLLAGPLGFSPPALFAADAPERIAVAVTFDTPEQGA
jgi:LemA protein